MTLTLLLVRHAAHDDVGRFLAGRSEPVLLGEEGRKQARRVAERVREHGICEIYTSPRTRTQETAAAIASACGVGPPKLSDSLDEIDFGRWAGSDFGTLNNDPLWRRWNTVRSFVRAPGGETLLEVQNRVLRLIETLRERQCERVVFVSHADVIKATVCYVLGLPLDAWTRFDIAPASVTTMLVGDWGAKLVALNEVTLAEQISTGAHHD